MLKILNVRVSLSLGWLIRRHGFETHWPAFIDWNDYLH